MNNIATTANEESAKTLTTVIYALYAASYFVGVTAIVAIVMYVKRDDVAGTFLGKPFPVANQDILVWAALECAGSHYIHVHCRMVCADC
ncbi:MAG TPA: hypothetical protein VIF10_14090 [Methylobacter sp.]|jgi:uncharacterized membrane protein